MDAHEEAGEDTFIGKCLKSQGAKPVSITRD